MDSLSPSSQYDSANVAPPLYSLFYDLEGQSGCACTYRGKYEGIKELTSGPELLTPAHYECAVSGCWMLHSLANSA